MSLRKKLIEATAPKTVQTVLANVGKSRGARFMSGLKKEYFKPFGRRASITGALDYGRVGLRSPREIKQGYKKAMNNLERSAPPGWDSPAGFKATTKRYMTVREELLEQAREFLESVSVRSRKQVAQDLFHAVKKKWPDEGFTALDKKYPGAVKNVKKSVKDSMLTRVQRRHARRHPK